MGRTRELWPLRKQPPQQETRFPSPLLFCFLPNHCLLFVLAITGGSISFKLSRFASSVPSNKVLSLIEPYQFLPAAGMGSPQTADSSPPDGTGWSLQMMHCATPPYAEFTQVL